MVVNGKPQSSGKMDNVQQTMVDKQPQVLGRTRNISHVICTSY